MDVAIGVLVVIIIFVLIILFAAIIRPFGLFIATFLAFMLSIFGSTEMRLIESTIAAIVMTLFCYALFVWLLNLPFQLWPQPNAHVVLVRDIAEFLRLIVSPLLKMLGVL